MKSATKQRIAELETAYQDLNACARDVIKRLQQELEGESLCEGGEKKHKCEGILPDGGNGSAVDGCFEKNDGTLWVYEVQYSSQVAFCPYCGYRAKVKPTVTKIESAQERD